MTPQRRAYSSTIWNSGSRKPCPRRYAFAAWASTISEEKETRWRRSMNPKADRLERGSHLAQPRLRLGRRLGSPS